MPLALESTSAVNVSLPLLILGVAIVLLVVVLLASTVLKRRGGNGN